jgi:endo-1,4-beta-xylanase
MQDNNIKSLCKEYQEYFPIGAAVNHRVIETHSDLIIRQFNSITAENEMKPVWVHGSENSYTFEKADSIAEFAQSNHMRIRGHTLVWHNQTPGWFFTDSEGKPASKELLLRRMKEHIHTVAGHYRGKTYCWDVVNEAVADDPAVYLRKSKWLELVGEEFIEKAFEYAHEADPDALLFYNDYNESAPEKCEKICRLVKSLKDRDVPIHGLGLQGHWSIYWPSLDMIRRALDKYAVLGLELQITELDVSLYDPGYKGKELAAPLPDLLERQAEYYGKIFEVFREYKDVITNVTFWGAADDVTWLYYFPVMERKNWPLLFDDEHQPKAAFFNVINK